MRTRAKVDGNHADIVKALRLVGATVQSLASIGKGCPDLLVGYRGRLFLLEVKSPGGKLTADEERWAHEWLPHARVVTSTQDALAAIGVITTGTRT